MEIKFITEKGNIATRSYWTCIWNNCEFFNSVKSVVVAHSKTCVHGYVRGKSIV